MKSLKINYFIKKIQNSEFLNIISNGLFFLQKKEKNKLFQLGFMSVLCAAYDTLTVSLLAPVIGLIVNPDPWFSNYYFNLYIKIIGSNEINFVIFITGIIFCVAVVFSVIFNILLKYYFLVFSTDCRNRYAEELSSRILDAPYFWLNDKNAVLNAKIINVDLPAWSRLFLNKVLTLGNSMFLIIFVMVFCSLVAPTISFIILSSITLFSLTLFFISFKYFKHLATLTKIYMNNGVITGSELFLGIKEIKLYQKKAFFLNKFLFNFKNEGFVDCKLLTARQALSLTLIGVAQIVMILTIFILYFFADNKLETIVEIGIVIVAISRLLPASNKVFADVVSLWDNKIKKENIMNLDLAIPPPAPKVIKELIGEFNSLTLENISYKFTKSGQLILQNINLKLNKGKKYGIVGSSGSGKTTLIDMIFGLLKPSKGKIILNGETLNETTLMSFQEKIMYISQNNFILNENFMDNILFGNKYSKKNLTKAATDANLLDVILSKPKKWFYKVGDRGSMLSGGQKQRIALARGFYRNASILVLDEATNALDNSKEKEILSTIWNYQPALTVLIVAHRLSTVQDCDEIIVLEKGKIVGIDTYDNLLKNNYYFKKLAIHEIK